MVILCLLCNFLSCISCMKGAIQIKLFIVIIIIIIEGLGTTALMSVFVHTASFFVFLCVHKAKVKSKVYTFSP